MSINKKVSLILLGIVLMPVLALGAGRIKLLPTHIEYEIFGKHSNVKLVIIDQASSTGPLIYTLPSTNRRDGEVYVVKVIHDDADHVEIMPAKGDSFDQEHNSLMLTSGGRRSVSFAASEKNNTWYIINRDR